MKFDFGGQVMDAFPSEPESGGLQPSVLVIMEAFGVNGHLQDLVQRFARDGIVAISRTFFIGRTNGPPSPDPLDPPVVHMPTIAA